MNTATDFFEQASIARDRYVGHYRQAIEALRTEENFAVELLVKLDSRTTPAPFCLMRVDVTLGSVSALQVKRIADALTQEKSLSFKLRNGLDIRQDSFSWEAVRVTFLGEKFRVGNLASWLQKWLDPDETREADSSGLCGVVHDLSWSHSEPATWQLDIDFGSSPTEAIEELLDVLSAAGVTSLTLSRHDLEDA